MKKKAILAVSFGTSHLDTMAKTIQVMEDQIRETFPEYAVYRAFTSGIILKKLERENGLVFDNVRQAMERMKRGGVTDVIVQPTYIINGVEYDWMRTDVEACRELFETVRIGAPLLSAPDDYKKTAHAVMESVELAPDECLILMGHGTEHPANSAYPAMEYTLQALGYDRIHMATVEGFPELKDVMGRIRNRDIKKAVLLPFMLVAGDHAKNDMAGDEDSWKCELEEAGYEVRPILKGLGELPGIRRIFIEHIEAAR